LAARLKTLCIASDRGGRCQAITLEREKQDRKA